MSQPLAEGTVVAGKLQIIRLLGMGGMGAVYEVEHTFTKHRRALKLLHPEMVAHPVIVARFLREASAAGHIGDPHIIETFDAGTLESGAPYIVMELLQGETLQDRIDKFRGGLPLSDLVDLVRQACRGVQAAHAAGIVHRDLKPENIFLVEVLGRPFVKILDFGISKFDPALPGGAANTKEGAALGTPYYMSPEQVNGDKEIDGRTDIYALGVILYQCATGRRPFEADSLPKLAVMIHEAKIVPVSTLRPDLPASFSDIVMRAMARDRDARFSTAEELATALKPFGSASVDPTLPESKSFWPRVVVNQEKDAEVVIPKAPSTGEKALEPRMSGPTMPGTAVSVGDADVSRKKLRRTITVAGLAGLMLMGIGIAYTQAVAPRADDAVGLVSQGSAVPAQPSTTAQSTATAAQTARSSADAAAPDAGAQSVSAPARSVGNAAAAPPSAKASSQPAVPVVSAAPQASSRADQKGLVKQNPFE